MLITAESYMIDLEWAMRQALEQAALAASQSEVPVGAVLLDADGRIVGKGHNQVISRHDPTAHAEILALRQGASALANYRLPNTTLVVTLEPCLMCMGAVFNARVAKVVYGATDPKTGVCESTLRLPDDRRLNHHTVVQGGVLSKPCSDMLRTFFAQRRRQASQRSAT